MKKKIYLISIFFFTYSLFAEENPYSNFEFNFKNPIAIRTGGEIDFEVKVKLPQNHYLYLSHANSNGIGIITSFIFPENNGFQLLETSRPTGTKKYDEMVLKGTGTFHFKLFELGSKKVGSNTKIPLKIKTQLCEEKENGICYPPKTIEKDLLIEVKEGKKTISFRNLETIPWESAFQSATTKAKAANLNIYAILTEPSWCGACRYMDREAFDKPEVQKVLKEKFIPWKVKDNEYGKLPISGNIGLPTFFVLDADGKSLGKWVGARDAKGLLPLLKPFEKTNKKPDPAPAPIPVPPVPEITEDATQLEILSPDGSKCALTYGKDYPWTSKKEEDFHNSGTFRFGVNNQEVKVKQFTRDSQRRKTYPIALTKNGFRIEMKEFKEFWVAECKQSSVEGFIEGTDIRFTISK